ncbi:ABC transporter permease subunit [Halobellus sp. GM3]|uniref:ABC transporter permease subunit n=1 Tax=Halobellus sp. GM3 TaxID=3458410 RepID=UPI00403D9F35
MVTPLARRQKIRITQVAIFLGCVGFLEWFGRSGRVQYITFTPPSDMVGTLASLVGSGSIFNDLFMTAGTVFASFFAAVLVGIPAGALLWRQELLHRVLDPYLIAYYAMPIFAFYPVFIAIFGLNRIPIMVIGFFTSVVAIVVNTANGFENVKDVFVDVGRSLNLSTKQMFTQIYIPAAVPYIFTGLKLGFIYAMLAVLASEFILATNGIGYLIAYNYQNFATGEMYAGILLIVIIAVAVNLGLVRIENYLYRRSGVGE